MQALNFINAFTYSYLMFFSSFEGSFQKYQWRHIRVPIFPQMTTSGLNVESFLIEPAVVPNLFGFAAPLLSYVDIWRHP